MLISCSSPAGLVHPRRFLPLVSLFATIAGGCAPPTTIQGGRPATTRQPTQDLAPGIPNRPELVTLVSFYSKPNETDLEKTKVVIPAEVDGHSSIFILDLGSTPIALNRTFLQPSLTGGVDTITDANRLPDHTPMENHIVGGLQDWEKVHITLRIGTLLDEFDDPDLTRAAKEQNPHRYNAIMGHLWGNFSWVFAPRLGNIGPAALEQFETIIDYTHRRVVFIRLDQAGHRLVKVPAYTPRWTAPLVAVPIPSIPGIKALGLAVVPDHTLDTLNAAKNTQVMMLDTGSPWDEDAILGYHFLSNLGVFGLNQRTHQFILYH